MVQTNSFSNKSMILFIIEYLAKLFRTLIEYAEVNTFCPVRLFAISFWFRSVPFSFYFRSQKVQSCV